MISVVQEGTSLIGADWRIITAGKSKAVGTLIEKRHGWLGKSFFALGGKL